MVALIITVYVHGGKESHRYEFLTDCVVEVHKYDITIMGGYYKDNELFQTTAIIQKNIDDIIEIKIGKIIPWAN